MNSKKLSIRPELYLSSIIENENFQNKTLRSILKLQHDIIILLFVNFCKKNKLNIVDIKENVFLSEIEKIIKKNIVIRNQYIGLTVGQFTTDEFVEYTGNESEYNKRILNMIIQRISDSQSEIKKQ